MPIRLIGTIILLILVTIFAGVNLDNKCDITFIFYTFHDIPVFMTVIVSFAIGAVLMLPFTFGRKKKKQISQNKNPENQKSADSKEESKTLFDFKIKREAKPNEPKAEKPKKDKKSLFGFGKKPAASENSADKAESTPEDASIGTPV